MAEAVGVHLGHAGRRRFSPEEVARLLACYDPETPVGARERAILLILLDTGLRCSELVQLNLEDLYLDRARFKATLLAGIPKRLSVKS